MDRHLYIGSSDARAILSGDWDRLYREKKGLIDREDLSDKFHVRLGEIVEPFHIDWTVRRLNEARGSCQFDWSKGYTPATDQAGETHGSFVQHFSLATTEAGTPIGSHPDALLRYIQDASVLRSRPSTPRAGAAPTRRPTTTCPSSSTTSTPGARNACCFR